MSAGWKQTLYEYVRHANQRDLEYRAIPAAVKVADESFAHAEESRLRRLNQLHKERGMKPVECETRLRLLTVKEHSDDLVTADIEMTKRVTLRGRGVDHDESSVQRERVRLAASSGRWFVERIEPAVPERLSELSQPPSHPSDHKPPRKVAQPFINKDILESGPAGGSPRGIRYNRQQAAQYVDLHWNDPNPEYIHFDVDCTNYVSQCLFAGAAPMNYTGKRESGWWYRGSKPGSEQWSFSWAVAHSLRWHLGSSRSGLRGVEVPGPNQLQLGDVIVYDFTGNNQFQHSTIVTAFDSSGMPLVNAHTSNSKHRYWDYRDSYAWSDTIKYKFFHIPDEF